MQDFRTFTLAGFLSDFPFSGPILMLCVLTIIVRKYNVDSKCNLIRSTDNIDFYIIQVILVTTENYKMHLVRSI